MKKLPRKEVIEKQLAICTEEASEIEGDDLEDVHGGQSLSSIGSNIMRMGIMYGVPLHLYHNLFQRLTGGGGGSSSPKSE